jgi:ElaB/YqjD/DUF883 family membrane-anchored ribosome-binding protein
MKKETRKQIRNTLHGAYIDARIWAQDHPRTAVGVAAFLAGVVVGWILL